MPFLIKPETIKGLATWTGLPLNQVYRRVKRFERLGLLEVAHLERRRGRDIKHYQACAHGFSVPFALSAAADVPVFVNSQLLPIFAYFTQRLAESGAAFIDAAEQVTLRLFEHAGKVSLDISPHGTDTDSSAALLADAAPAVFCQILPLQLSSASAKALQREMAALLERYRQSDGAGDYVVHLGMVPGTFSVTSSPQYSARLPRRPAAKLK